MCADQDQGHQPGHYSGRLSLSHSPVNTLASMLGPDDGERARQGVEQTFKPLVTLQSLATDGDKYEGRPERAPDVTHCTRDSGLRSGLRPSEIGSMAFFTSVRY